MAKLTNEDAPSGTAPWSPDLAIDTKTAPLPRIAPCPPFLLQVHPKRWHVVAGRILPITARLPMQSGVAGGEVDNGRFKMRGAIAAREEKGWTVIPHDVDGPGTTYLCKVAGLDAFVERFEVVNGGTDTITHDLEGRCKWLEGLIASGKIPPCPRYTLDTLEAQTVDKLSKAKDLARTVPSAAVDVERFESDLKVIRKARGVQKLTPAKTEPAAIGMDR